MDTKRRLSWLRDWVVHASTHNPFEDFAHYLYKKHGVAFFKLGFRDAVAVLFGFRDLRPSIEKDKKEKR